MVGRYLTPRRLGLFDRRLDHDFAYGFGLATNRARQMHILWRKDRKTASAQRDEITVAGKEGHITIRVVRLIHLHSFNVRHTDALNASGHELHVTVSAMSFPATLTHGFGFVLLHECEQ